MEMTKKELLVEKITASVNEDQEFYKAIISAPDAATLQTVLKENGFDFTIAEIEECFTDGVTEILNYQAEELSENQLDDVAGGGFFRGTARLIVSCGVGFGYGVVCGLCPAASAGAGYVAGGLAIWTACGYKK